MKRTTEGMFSALKRYAKEHKNEVDNSFDEMVSRLFGYKFSDDIYRYLLVPSGYVRFKKGSVQIALVGKEEPEWVDITQEEIANDKVLTWLMSKV